MDDLKRKKPVKSPYLFPSYPFGTALELANEVARGGGNHLSETTLAISLGISAKSSGFRLKVLSARLFGLLTKQGEILRLTPLALAILHPPDAAAQRSAKTASFLAVPLFKAIAARFRGQPLPSGQLLRHLLEHDLHLERNRINESERIFLDSAREADLLRISGANTFLDTEISQDKSPNFLQQPEAEARANPVLPTSTTVGDSLLSISEADLANLSDDDYAEIWQALGKLVRARSRRLKKPSSDVSDKGCP